MVRPVVVIGDCALDVIVAPRLPARSGGDVPARVSLAPGGQAANVAVRLARRGVAVRLVSPLADDAAGHLLARAIADEGVALSHLPVARGTAVVVVLDPGGERTMLSDRATFPGGWAAGSDAIRDAARIVCSGYVLLDEVGMDLAAVLGRRPADVPLAVLGCDLPTRAAARRLRAAIAAARPQLVACNRDEAVALAGAPPSAEPVALAAALADLLGATCVVTDAELGSAAGGVGIGVTAPRTVAMAVAVDSTGAGDAYAAVLVDRLLGPRWPPAADELAAAMFEAAGLAAEVAGVTGAQSRVPGEDGVAGGPTRRPR